MKTNTELRDIFVKQIGDSLEKGVKPDDILMTIAGILNDFVLELNDLRKEF